jgi:ATP-binding cassette, subfamily B, multidrug efflux pump
MRSLRAVLPYLRAYRVPIAWGIVLVVVSTLLGMASVEAIKHGVDALAGDPSSRDVLTWMVGRLGLGSGSPGRVVLTWAAVSTALALLAGAGRYGMREILNGVSRRVELDLRNDLFAHLLRLDAGFYAAHPTGEIMSRATSDISAVRQVAGPAYMYLVSTIVFASLAVARMAWIDPWVTLVSLLPMLLLPPVTVYFGGVIHDRFERIQEQMGVISTMAQENLAGQRIVKAYGQEYYQSGRFRELSAEYLRRNVELARTSGLFYPLLGLLSGSALAAALWSGGLAVIRGDVTTGDFVLYLLYLGMLTWPLIALGWVINLFQRGAASMGRVSAILGATPAVRDAAEAAAPAQIRGEIEFREVWFRYPGSERDVLRGVSFRIPAGATVAVVGPTGSGKSTLVQLMVRLHDPTAGKVLVDGVDVARWPLSLLRGTVAPVPQDTFLFSTSIAENLAMGFEEPDPVRREERIRSAAATARLDEAVAEFPSGYETLLGERGVNLSGGQKQRAALARALARDARILVLDDALSAVDTHTEHEILERLRGAMAARTSVIVSHRVSAVMHADHILVLDDGRVVEQGTHAELIRRRGLYAQLQRRQVLAQAVDEDDVLAATR